MKGPYTIQPLEQHPERKGEYRTASKPEVHTYREEARRAFKRAYLRTGVVPAVFDDSGKEGQLLTNEEVANWGTEVPELF